MQAPQTVGAFAHPARNVDALGIQSGFSVADFGSGSGAYVLAVAEQLKGSGHVYAVDVQKDLLRRISNEAKKRGFKNVEVIWADLDTPNSSKLAPRLLDLVLASNVLFQVSDKKALLSEARRVLKTTGRLAIIDWSDSFGNLGPTKEEVVTREKSIKLAEAAGFGLVKEFSAGAHHYGLIMRPVAVQS